jgi:aspartate carbamoyltransferase catalytic subunit
MTNLPLKHLLDIESLSRQQLNSLLDLGTEIAQDPSVFANRLDGQILVNLFFEPSTRTRLSFEIAAKRLGMQVVNFQSESSSAVKGEALSDTFHTVAAMGPEVIAIRHSRDGVVESLAEHADTDVHIINAGDGSYQHPTQALVDALTLKLERGDLSQLTITIAGDITHSRVAGSAIEVFKKLGVADIRLAGPVELLPDAGIEGVEVYSNLDDAVRGADVVMMLRIQRERFGSLALPDEHTYFETWGLTSERLSLAASDCLVMHPGPANRGVEIASEVADGKQSVIRQQVRNGVYARMAVLLTLLEHP